MCNFLPAMVISLLTVTPGIGAGEVDPLVGDRPDVTESAVTVAPGRVQVEAGFTHANAEDAGATEVGEALVRFGLTQTTEARVKLPGWFTADAVDGWLEAGVGVKQILLRGDGARPQVAVIAATTLPTGTEGLAAQEVQPELIAAAGWDLGERTGLGVNVGCASLHDDVGDERYASAWLTASLGVAAGERLGFFVEAYGFDGEVKDGGSRGYADLGATCLVTADLQLDVRAGRGFNGLDDEWFVGAGLVVRR